MKRLRKLILIPNTSKYIDSVKLGALISYLVSLECELSMFDCDRSALSDLPEYAAQIEVYSADSAYDAAVVLGGDGSIIEAEHRLIGKKRAAHRYKLRSYRISHRA